MFACRLCGGTAGIILDENDAHNLCKARAALGLPTPCLGHPCPDCKGRGVKPNSPVGPTLFFEGNSPGSIKRAIDAWAPKCATCNGTGLR